MDVDSLDRSAIGESATSEVIENFVYSILLLFIIRMNLKWIVKKKKNLQILLQLGV